MVDFDDDTKLTSHAEVLKQASGQRNRAYLIVLQGPNVGEMYKLSDDETVIGRSPQCNVQIVADGISRRHARVLHLNGEVFVEDLGSTNGTFLNGEQVQLKKLSDGDKVQVGEATILKFTYHDNLDESFQRQMYESALRDGLTKIYNKKYFLDRLEAEFAFAQRHRSPLSLIMFDVDHFKKINDTHGHLAGDFVLATLAATVQETIRQEDVFARYGGEEFSIICRGIGVPGAEQFAERVRRVVQALPFVHQGTQIPVTVSLGVSGLPDAAARDPLALIGRADTALYEAKRGGRNRVVAATPAAP